MNEIYNQIDKKKENVHSESIVRVRVLPATVSPVIFIHHIHNTHYQFACNTWPAVSEKQDFRYRYSAGCGPSK